MKTHADPGEAAPRRGSRWVVDVAILTGALLALVAATLAVRWAWTPAPGPEEQVSCAPYFLLPGPSTAAEEKIPRDHHRTPSGRAERS